MHRRELIAFAEDMGSYFYFLVLEMTMLIHFIQTGLKLCEKKIVDQPT